MAFALNAAEVLPLTDEFTPLPAGTYNVKITNIEEKPTQAGGLMIVFTMEVLDGKHKGRKLWNNFNVVNENPKAVDIARRGISTVCHLLGNLDFRTETYGTYYERPFAVKVGIKTDDQGRENNRISAWLAYQAPNAGLVPAPVAPARPIAPAPAPVAPPPQYVAPAAPVAPAAAPVAPAPVAPVFAPPVAQPMIPPVAPAPIPAPVPAPVAAPVAPVAPVTPAPVAAPTGDIPAWAQG